MALAVEVRVLSPASWRRGGAPAASRLRLEDGTRVSGTAVPSHEDPGLRTRRKPRSPRHRGPRGRRRPRVRPCAERPLARACASPASARARRRSRSSCASSGRDTVIEEALRDHLNGWYSRAVAVAGIDPVDAARRSTGRTSRSRATPFSFTAEVEVKPAPDREVVQGPRRREAAGRRARRGGRLRDRAAAPDGRRAAPGRPRRGRGRLPRDRLRGDDRRQAVRRRRRHRLRRRARRRPPGARPRARPDRDEGRATSATSDLPLPPDHEDASIAGQGRHVPRDGEGREGAGAAGARRRAGDVGQRVRHARRAARRHPRAHSRGARARGRHAVPGVGARLARRPARDRGARRARAKPRGRPGPVAAPEPPGPRRRRRGLPARHRADRRGAGRLGAARGPRTRSGRTSRSRPWSPPRASR